MSPTEPPDDRPAQDEDAEKVRVTKALLVWGVAAVIVGLMAGFVMSASTFVD